MDQIVFTPSSVLDLLSKIEELSEYEISLTETMEGQLQLQVGSSVYFLEEDNSKQIEVDKSTVEEIVDTNISTYEELESNDLVQLSSAEPVQSGLIKEIAKTLLVGGMVRLTSKMLSKGLR